MSVVSVDLAYRRWTDLGVVVLDRTGAPGEAGPIACEMIHWDDPGSVEAETLAGRLNHLCNVRQANVLMLDGPQAWKSSRNGLLHARTSERQLNTVAKTGLPGVVKPANYRNFAEFCVDVYDALCRRGWRRLDASSQPSSTPQRILVESYPFAAWRSLGLKPLPSKRRARVSDLAEAFTALKAVVPLSVSRPPNHDQLQAIVGGLPGLALEAHEADGARIFGTPPRREEGHWREGFIVLPVPPRKSTRLRWLN